VSNNTLQWTADEPNPQRGYCGHHAKARVGNYAISPSVTFGSLVRYRVAYMPTGTVMDSRTIGHYRTLNDARQYAAAMWLTHVELALARPYSVDGRKNQANVASCRMIFRPKAILYAMTG
jgi:hypothetical protein